MNILEKQCLKGSYRIEFVNIETGVIDKVIHKNNLITDVFRDALLKMLNYSNEGIPTPIDFFDINYLVLGSNATAPTVGDTTLGTETFRKLITSKVLNDNVIEVITQLKANEANSTFYEIGIVSKGTATVDTGNLLSHASISIEKNSNFLLNVYFRLEVLR